MEKFERITKVKTSKSTVVMLCKIAIRQRQKERHYRRRLYRQQMGVCKLPGTNSTNTAIRSVQLITQSYAKL